MMMAAEHYVFTGRDGDVVPRDVTHVRIDKSLKVIPRRAFYCRRNIEEVVFDVSVETVEEYAFLGCRSLRRVIMPGVKVVSGNVLYECEALADVECGELEIIGIGAFGSCRSLRSINLPSVKIVQHSAFDNCKALTDVKFGNKLERIERRAFIDCRSLRRITLPLKDGLITRDNTFTGCVNLEHVDPVGGIHETVAALQLEEWRNDMDDEIDSINQILPNAPAGTDSYMGEKAMVIRTWIRSVLRKIRRIHQKTFASNFH